MTSLHPIIQSQYTLHLCDINTICYLNPIYIAPLWRRSELHLCDEDKLHLCDKDELHLYDEGELHLCGLPQ